MRRGKSEYEFEGVIMTLYTSARTTPVDVPYCGAHGVPAPFRRLP